MTGKNPFILIIEDDEFVGQTVSRVLMKNQYRVKHINNGVEGLKFAREYKPDLIILDVVMQGMDGFTVCEKIRADIIIKNTPVIFLTAKIKDEDRIRGLVAGADDYITKPFNNDELNLRIKAILRRSNQIADIVDKFDDSTNPIPVDSQGNAIRPFDNHKIDIGEYSLNIRSYELNSPHNGNILLTPIQYQLVYYLITHADKIFSPARLLVEVWNFPPDIGSTDLVRVHIKNLRQRIELDPRNPTFIQTVPGYGYTIKNSV